MSDDLMSHPYEGSALPLSYKTMEDLSGFGPEP